VISVDAPGAASLVYTAWPVLGSLALSHPVRPHRPTRRWGGQDTAPAYQERSITAGRRTEGMGVRMAVMAGPLPELVVLVTALVYRENG
jgi:hypothetical protein